MPLGPWDLSRTGRRERVNGMLNGPRHVSPTGVQRHVRRSRFARCVRGIAVALGVCATAGHAQPRVLDPPTCADCRIDFELVAVLGTDSGPPGIGPTFTIARSAATGYLWYSSSLTGGQILSFRPDGSFSESFGGRGQGPGEFIWITELLTSAGRLHALDPANQRWTVFSTHPPGDLISTARIPGAPHSSVIFEDTLLVSNINIRSRELAGIPLHVFGHEGTHLGSFGDDGQGYRFDRDAPMLRLLAGAGPSRIWAAHAGEYRIERWALDGRRDSDFRREVDWFSSPNLRGVYADPDTPPEPWVAGVQQDLLGRLWIAVHVADEEWYEGVSTEQNAEGSYFPLPDRAGFQDTMIEVIDPAAGRVLASTRFEYPVATFVDASHFAVYRESEAGVPTIEIWHFDFTGAPRGEEG